MLLQRSRLCSSVKPSRAQQAFRDLESKTRIVSTGYRNYISITTRAMASTTQTTTAASRRANIKGPQDVDTSLHPYPSGRAKDLADKHQQEHPLKLYGGWFCPFVQRVWIVLHEKRIEHQYVEINPYHKAPEFMELNPRGLVPTLAVPVSGSSGKGQKPLYESVVVAEYLEDAYSDASKYEILFPEDTYERARCRLWIDHISTKIVPAFYRFMQHTSDKEYTLEEARQAWWNAVLTWVAEMGDDGPWFLGKRFSMVDAMLAPWAMRLFLLDHYKNGGAGEPAEKDARWDRWTVWYQAAIARESVKDTWSDDARYVDAYKRYADDTAGSQMAQTARGSTRLN